MNPLHQKTAVIAIGGNSLISDNYSPDVPHQWDAVRETCRHLADMIEDGWTLVITHGNGPQVGFIMRRNEIASSEIHTTPLDLIVADTQGSIGYMLQQALRNELYSRDIRKPVVSVVTQVLVRKDDPAFENASKPIGSFMSEEEARKYEKDGWKVVEDAGRGWRRVVASPIPLRVIEEDAIRTLVSAGNIVIAVGGGGIPVIHNTKGELRELAGVYAVIDKDRASGLLAQQLNADLYLISTAVDKVCINFNTPEQEEIDQMNSIEAQKYLDDNQFAPGSMKPKIEAVVRYLENGGKHAIVTSPEQMGKALRGEAGTHIVV